MRNEERVMSNVPLFTLNIFKLFYSGIPPFYTLEQTIGSFY